MEPLTDEEKWEILKRLGWSLEPYEGNALLLSEPKPLRTTWVQGSREEAVHCAWRWMLKREPNLFRHKKGGVYRKLHEARHADGGDVIVYEHIWPHERGVWVRDKAEFEEPGRFERITK